MGSHVLQILRQGVWAALTGGWYHDPEDSRFNNICHLYLWIFLLLLPLAMHLGLPPTTFTLCLYCISTTVLFAAIKFVSFRLHLMFDKGIVIHHKQAKSKQMKNANSINVTNGHTVSCNNSKDAGVESHMKDISQCHQDSNSNISSDSLVMQTQALDHCEEIKASGRLREGEFQQQVERSSPTYEVELPGPSASPQDNSRTEDVLEHVTCCPHPAETQKSLLENEHFNITDQKIQDSAQQLLYCQVTRKQKIIYEVTHGHPSQQDSSVLQVLCGTETSMEDDTLVEAMHGHTHSNGNTRSCSLNCGDHCEMNCEHRKPSCASLAQETEFNSETETMSENQGLFSDDPEEESFQKQVSLMVAKISQCETPEPLSRATENLSHISSEKSFAKKQFYKFRIFPGKWVKIWCDRLTLLALLDKTENIVEDFLTVLLAICVSFFGFLVLHQDLFKDIWIFHFCVVIASCQFCLLKSVQPDPASPVHGHNQIIKYSRPIYFCILCGLILLLDSGSKVATLQLPTLYGFHLFSPQCFQTLRDQIIVFVSCFPIISLLGLFPQINTFCIYFLEQIDILAFGGTATVGLVSALYSLLRSTLAVAILYIFCNNSIKEPWDIRHIPSLFSTFCGLLVALSYHLSRQSSDPSIIISLIKKLFPGFLQDSLTICCTQQEDTLLEKMKTSVKEVLISDLVTCIIIAFLSFAVSASTVFLSLRPFLSIVLLGLALTVGFLAHYIIPQLRKHHPWLWISQPVLQNKEYKQREIFDAAQLMWFEKFYVWLICFEKYVLYPSIILNAVTIEAFSISKYKRFGKQLDAFLIAVAGMKLLRSCFCSPFNQYVTLGFTALFFQFDYGAISESFLIDFYIMSIMFYKIWDLLYKMKYVLTYIAPWQIAWGSSFHVFAQFFAIPHSALLLIQTVATSIFSSPLSPYLGSVIFIPSYVRPVKFWEENNSTNRLDKMNRRLQSQIENNSGNDDNLNSVFYEHLARSLQHSLCGDLILGRWGNYASGDCFILASDYLNAFVHLVETGNGLVTFQLRGLEFKGTYCHQREVEAITEGDEDNEGCCCFQTGHLPHILSCNSAFNLRWLTWEVARAQYILEGYSVIYSNAESLLQVFDLRKILIKYYVKSIIYFTARSPKLLDWLKDKAIQKALQPYTKWNHVENDLAMFNINFDEDYIPCLQGITRASFCSVYLDWIQFCIKKEAKKVNVDEDSSLVTLSFGLCILGRKLLATTPHEMSLSLDSFLHGLHTLFKGHYEISKEEEWVFADMDLLHTVVAPAIRMSLKLHQGQFACPEEYEDPPALYEAIKAFEEKVVICNEEDPAWRSAILSNKEELLTLRHAVDEGRDEYSVIMLHKSYLSFKVIKVNKECVRGLWSGQQQELIFLRNRDHERGSIQNNKHVLRNLINSSCDQPLGYPIYVSPLTTSYLGTHEQLKNVLMLPIHFDIIRLWFQTKWLTMRKEYGRSHQDGCRIEEGDCGGGCSSLTSHSESYSSQSFRNSPNVCNKNSDAKSLEIKIHQSIGKRKQKSHSAHTHSSLHQIPPMTSLSGPNIEKNLYCDTLRADYTVAKRLSSSHQCLTDSSVAPYPHAAVASATGRRNIHEQTRGLQQSSQTSSTNSTLSLLFGKKGFSSALVLSGLSAADGDNTADTLSSSSVNLVMCPHSRVEKQSKEKVYGTHDTDELSDAGQEHPAEAAETSYLE
ncbi:pecanex-like protein 2 [Pseudophryne corroboree]|uniref:pecanex-like protein 2 n=1 Tax=Pseudophryne corroboree TaxID=495146 RepID=UPI00308213A6